MGCALSLEMRLETIRREKEEYKFYGWLQKDIIEKCKTAGKPVIVAIKEIISSRPILGNYRITCQFTTPLVIKIQKRKPGPQDNYYPSDSLQHLHSLL